MRKAFLLLALTLPLNGSHFLFGVVPFRSELSALAQKAIDCVAGICATAPGDLRDAPAAAADLPSKPIPVVGSMIPGRAFLIVPPPQN